MIILDTNVLSEPARPSPSPVVLAWLDAQDRLEVYTTAITQAEILGGIAAMPAGKRRDLAAEQAQRLLSGEFGGRILPFDSAAAVEFHTVARLVKGKYVMDPDAQIAAIVKAHGAIFATRNVKHFRHCGIELVNPWNPDGNP